MRSTTGLIDTTVLATSFPVTTSPEMNKRTPTRSRAKTDLFKKYKPDPHQEISLKHAQRHDGVLDFSDAGTGKTPVALWDYARHRAEGGGKALVICLRSLMVNVWANSVHKFTPHLSCAVARADNRSKQFALDVDIYITNTDAAVWLAKQPKKFFDGFDYLIIDESSSFKHHTSMRSRAIAKIRKYFRKRRLMTGTPMSLSITDVWHQALIVDDGKRLGTSFYAFRNQVSTPTQVGMNANALHWEDKPGAEEAVFALLGDITVRHDFDDVVNIPERRVYAESYELSPKHRKAYDQLERDQFMIYQDLERKGTVSAVHKAALRMKLLQVASGAVYADHDPDGRPTHTIDTARYEYVMDLAVETPHTVIMFLWKHQRDALVKEAEARKLRYVVIDGSSSDKVRENIEADYQAGKYDVVIAHPQTLAHGLTLTLGTTLIWSSPTDNTEWFEQANRRQARRGQTQKTRVLTVVGKDTADEAAYENCINKGQRQENFLGYFRLNTIEEQA